MKIPDIAWPTFFDSYRESMLIPKSQLQKYASSTFFNVQNSSRIQKDYKELLQTNFQMRNLCRSLYNSLLVSPLYNDSVCHQSCNEIKFNLNLKLVHWCKYK